MTNYKELFYCFVVPILIVLAVDLITLTTTKGKPILIHDYRCK